MGCGDAQGPCLCSLLLQQLEIHCWGRGGVPRTPVAKQESLIFSGFPLGTGLQGLLERWPAMEPQVGWMGSKVLSHWMGSGGGVQNQKFLLVHSHHSSFLPSCLR